MFLANIQQGHDIAVTLASTVSLQMFMSIYQSQAQFPSSVRLREPKNKRKG